MKTKAPIRAASPKALKKVAANKVLARGKKTLARGASANATAATASDPGINKTSKGTAMGLNKTGGTGSGGAPKRSHSKKIA